MSKILLVVPIAVLLLTSTSWAEPDFGRSGWYVGVGGGASFSFLDEAIRDYTNGAVDTSNAGSFNARGGYRLASWFAFELMYEGAYGYETDVLGVDAAETNTHAVIGNLKFIVPTWRIHPYLMIGPGVQHADFDGKGILFDQLDTSRWDFMLRMALGVDGYITENWLVNLEVAPAIRFADYTNVPTEITDNIIMSVGLGLQYRF